MPQSAPKDLNSPLSKLQISQGGKAKKSEPADSWEDELDDASEGQTTPVMADTSPGPPPPTPSSPFRHTADGSSYHHFEQQSIDGAFDFPQTKGRLFGRRDDSEDERRPEKSTAVASRLIAAGIGQKAPRRTKEEREYDQAMKVQEKKKRDAARDEEERKKREKEKAISQMWTD